MGRTRNGRLATALQAGEGVVSEINPDVFGEEGVDPLDFLEHLLGDVAVRDVPLLRRAQLDEVVDLAEIPGEQHPLAEGQGKDVLSFPGEIQTDNLICLLLSLIHI